MSRRKKKFGSTTVGKILGGALGLVNPALGGLITGDSTPEDLIQQIKDSAIPSEDKIRAQELVLEAYEAEVEDRVSARQREALVAASGGSDILFKTIGWSIAAAFLAVVGYGLGIIPQPKDINNDFLMFASGSVTSAFMAVVSYYFGSSMGSKQKQDYLNEKPDRYDSAK